MRIDIVTIFPEMVEPYTNGSILGRAQKNKKVTIKAHQLRKWTSDKHNTVDDKPFGGGGHKRASGFAVKGKIAVTDGIPRIVTN